MVMNELDFKLKLGYDYAVSYIMPFAKRIAATSSNEEVYMFVNASGYVECIGGVVPDEAVPKKYMFHLGHEDRDRFKRLVEEEIAQHIENVLTRWQRKSLEKYSKKRGVSLTQAFSQIYVEGLEYVEGAVWTSLKCEIMQNIYDVLWSYYLDE